MTGVCSLSLLFPISDLPAMVLQISRSASASFLRVLGFWYSRLNLRVMKVKVQKLYITQSRLKLCLQHKLEYYKKMALCLGKVDTKTFPLSVPLTLSLSISSFNKHLNIRTYLPNALSLITITTTTTSTAPMPKRLGPRHTTHPLIWCVSIICAILIMLVIIGGVVIFIGYATLRPKVPQVSVTRAQMDTIYFDQSSLVMLHATIVIKAENDNTRAHARFYDMSYTLSFRSQKIAILMADPFDVSPNRSLELNFVVPSQSIPLNPEEVEAINWSLGRRVVDLDLRGMSRTRWKVWLIGSIKYVLRMDCQLHLPIDQTTIYPHCVSRK